MLGDCRKLWDVIFFLITVLLVVRSGPDRV